MSEMQNEYHDAIIFCRNSIANQDKFYGYLVKQGNNEIVRELYEKTDVNYPALKDGAFS